MTQTELPSVDVAQAVGETQGDHEGRVARRGLRWWFGAVSLGFLAAWVASALLFAWIRWGRFDPVTGSSQARERVNIQLSPAEHPWYFPMLMLHVMGATVALATCVLQIWPWLRRRHPRIHRYSGRVYVFAGVYPAVIFALVVEAFWPFSVSTAVSQVVLALLWGSVTTYGWVLNRQGRIEDHRRWMLRSFALTTSVLVELAINPWVEMLTATQLDTRLGGSQDIFLQVATINENWLGLTIVILLVEGYLEREQLRRSAGHRLSTAPGGSTADAGTASAS